MKTNIVYNEDCLKVMKTMESNSIDFILTDIPYGEVSRTMNGICNYDLNLGAADKVTLIWKYF